jgi:hypothetical protein
VIILPSSHPPPINHTCTVIMFATINPLRSRRNSLIVLRWEDAYCHYCATVILCEDAQKAWYRQGSTPLFVSPENKLCPL